MDTDSVQSTTPRITHRRRALTIVELLMSLAITGLVASTVAGLLVGVSYGTSSKRDLRTSVVRGKTLEARLGAVIRSSRAIMETGSEYIVVWAGDVNTNGTADAPDLSELRLIERDDDADELRLYRFPHTWTAAQIAAADATYTLAGNPAGYFQTQTSTAKTVGSFQPALWSSGVTAVSFVSDTTDPTTSGLVSYRITLQAGDLSETVVGAAARRYEEAQ